MKGSPLALLIMEFDADGMGPPHQLCRVGYALNAKKLRRAASSPERRWGENVSHPVWRGGGLADILEIEPSAGELVQFIPWDPDTPPDSEPNFHVIIHKLTEDIESEGSPKLKILQVGTAVASTTKS